MTTGIDDARGCGLEMSIAPASQVYPALHLGEAFLSASVPVGVTSLSR